MPQIQVKQNKVDSFTLTFQAAIQSVVLTSHILMRKAGSASPSPTALHGRSVDGKRGNNRIRKGKVGNVWFMFIGNHGSDNNG